MYRSSLENLLVDKARKWRGLLQATFPGETFLALARPGIRHPSGGK